MQRESDLLSVPVSAVFGSPPTGPVVGNGVLETMERMAEEKILRDLKELFKWNRRAFHALRDFYLYGKKPKNFFLLCDLDIFQKEGLLGEGGRPLDAVFEIFFKHTFL